MTEDPQIFEVTLDNHAYGGESIGRLPDGRAVFVPFTLPGERVRVQLVEEKRGFARAVPLELLEASPERSEPRCAHYGVCGGCHYQHLPYEAQLKAKTAILRDQLERIGKIESPPVAEMVACPEPWHYRNHMQFHPAGEGQLGFQMAGGEFVTPITECHLPQGALNEIWPRLELEDDPNLLRVGLRLGAEESMLLVLESETDEALDFTVDFPIAAVQAGPEQTHILADSFYLVMESGGRLFRVSAESFFQVNTVMAEKLVEHLLAELPLTPESTVLDVYCGVGLFSAFIAPKVARLIGIEESSSACADFVVNLDEFENVELYEDAAEQVLPGLDVVPDVVIVDPPRAGLDTAALDTVVKLAPPVLAYVSCDPATLARDAKRLLAAGYSLKQVTPFDLFPQTYHIESVSIFEK